MPKIDPRDFLLNTDYEMDKIIYFTKGELNAGQYDVDIPHKLGFVPLIFGVCAFNSDFSDPRSIPYNYTTQSNTISFTATAYRDKIRVSYINYDGSPSKIYYRIYGFEPSNSHTTISPTAKYAKEFILNTDYNYCKLFKKGIVSAKTNTTVEHNLGYIPQVLVWSEIGGAIEPIERADWGNTLGSQSTWGVAVTDKEVKLNMSQYQFDNIHYRIYYDQA